MASKKVRVAIIGVGNCASSLVQGVQFYKDVADDAFPMSSATRMFIWVPRITCPGSQTANGHISAWKEGTTFGDVPLNVEMKLEVWDSPNSAGVMIDAIRCTKIALDRRVSGPIIGPSSYFFKTPPNQFRDDVSRQKVEAFIKGEKDTAE